MFGSLNLYNILIGVPTTLLALTVHEFSHGLVSTKLGDPTPKYQGRLTLNPLAHLDLVGTLLMVITGFGWAKPVQVNPRYYKNQKRGMALVALAGPLSNFLLAFIGFFVGMGIAVACEKAGNMSVAFTIANIAYFFAFRNLCFMVFNLIPMPPLDGFKVLGMFIPSRAYYQILRYEQYVIFAIMALSLLGAFDVIIGTGVNFFLSLIGNMATAFFGLFL